MSTSYAGIDYSHGLGTNQNTKTGIRFGVISASNVGQAWYDDSEAVYTYTCPKCGTELKKGADAKRCPSCYVKIDSDRDFDFLEPNGYKYVKDGYKAFQTDETDIFVEQSPYFTYAKFCSPCAPGACHLENELDAPNPNNRTYCFGHDWFEDDKAPYTVYSVETGEIVAPKRGK